MRHLEHLRGSDLRCNTEMRDSSFCAMRDALLTRYAGWRTVLALAIAVFATTSPCAAQAPISLRIAAVFFGDDTELSNPFRPGETILGSNQRIIAEIEAGDHAALQFGVYALERAGSHSPVDRALPIVSLRLHSPTHHFTLGTLSTDRTDFGPDRTTPHGLLPPLARETLWFTRAYEVGIQWQVHTVRVAHELWYNHQKLNTPEHREQFDAGTTGRFRIYGPAAAAYQVHLVHHGGELYENGSVSDSFAFAPGVVLRGAVGSFDALSLELFGLASHDRPDRAAPSRQRTISGTGLFLRTAAEKSGWRGHVIVWRGNDFNHEDGDAHYQSHYATGAPYRGTRDYGEAGVAKLFRPAPGVDVEASGRLHRVERDIGYSFRLVAIVNLAWRLHQ
jgi:hypothetical protein